MAQGSRYEIRSKLGEGGMGAVYLAYDTVLKREVAIKRPLPAEGQDPEAWQEGVPRLIREAQAAAGLEHPHIVAIYDVISDEGPPFIVMKYVRGKTLAKTVLPGTPVKPSLALRVLKECAGALDHAHARGVIHRDIKPENIMLDETGSVQVMDFGIAKLLNSGTITAPGTVIGTYLFMSPEQINAAPVDGKSDQYSLAVVAYRLLTGCKVFEAQNLGVLCRMILLDLPEPASRRNPGLPKPVDTVLWRRRRTCAMAPAPSL